MYKTIVVPVDIAHLERAPAMLAAARQLGPDADIVIAHAIEPLPGSLAAEIPEDVLKQSRREVAEKMAKLKSEAGAKVRTEILDGGASSAILELAKKVSADAIVIASHKPGWQDYLIGSTAARVVRHANCSVFVLR